jgi:GT2 family glycosyltransferase/glycosyltransferase involved in cell wall biosynthesis
VLYSRGMTPDLSIIVLSWNVADLLAGCLQSLPVAAGDWWERTEVIVVDNASTDASVSLVRTDFPHVRLVALTSNLGFSGGNNAGIQVSRGQHILLLNADTLARPLSIEALANYLDANPGTGIVGPRLLNPDGSTQSSRRRFPTVVTALVESTPVQRWFSGSRLLRDFYMLDRPDEETQQVDWLSGAALMCRRETLMQVGLLDPGYFMFSEEVDLCKRVAAAGWDIAYLPEARIVHYGGQSTEQDVPARHIHFNTSKARYFRLHEGSLAGRIVRRYLLGVYVAQSITEGAKWLVGHKRALRAERLRMYSQVLKSGLREQPLTSQTSDKVLLITGEYPPARGGVGDYTCRLALALHSIQIGSRVLISYGAPVNEQATEPSPYTGESGSKAPLATRWINLRSAMRALRFSRARIAHIQYQTGAYQLRPTVNFLPLLLRLRWGGPCVVTFHDLLVPYLFPKAGPVREWANRLLALSASAVVATNPYDAERLRSWGVNKLKVIPIGSNIRNNAPTDFSREEWRASRGVGPDNVLLAYFGFLNQSKGLEDLLHVVDYLRTLGNFRLMMVGGGLGASDPTNKATAAHLEKVAADLGVQDRLLWTGYLSPQEVSAALLSADIAVLPFMDGASFRRGSLLATLEHALPVITTHARAQPSPEIASWPRLKDGENALLVPPGDREALARAVHRLSADNSLRHALSKGATDLAHHFNWERIAQMHAELYRELLGEETSK